jgi:cysteine-rich repeat protein
MTFAQDRALVLSWLVAVACLIGVVPSCGGDADPVVVVHVDGPATLPEIFRLRAILSNADTTDSKLFPLAGAPAQAIMLGTAFSLTLPRGHHGQLDVALDALNAAGAIVANGAASVAIVAGSRAEVTVTLGAGASLCGDGHVDTGEECDDGDRISNGTCDFRCQTRIDNVNTRGGAGGGAGDAGAGAGGAGGVCSLELLTNGSFDAGEAGWAVGSTVNTRLIYMGGDPALGGFAPASGPYLALLGRNVQTGQETLSQSIHVPAAAKTLTMQGSFHTGASTCATCNIGAVEIVLGSTVVPVIAWTGLDGKDGWQTFSANVDAVALRSAALTFRLRVTVTGGSISPYFFDSLSLKADRCAP